jgi:hypothetical protein
VDEEVGLFETVDLTCEHITPRRPYAEKILPSYSPENMPWDSSLNQDVHAAVQWRVLLTLALGVHDKHKFDMSTPKRGSWAYH